MLAQSKWKRHRNENKHGEIQEWKEQNKKTFILVKISCNFWQLLVTSKQLITVEIYAICNFYNKWITAFMHA